MINQNLTFGDICDQVATKIIQTINQSNKKLLVGFSGGVDSTVLLTALLKNQIDTDRLVLLTSSTLIIENQFFYKKFVENKIRCEEITQFKGNHEDYFHIWGEFGDALFLQNSPMKFHEFYNLPWTTPLKGRELNIVGWILKNDIKLIPWLYDKILIAKEFCPFTIETTGAFWWWLTFNVSWNDIYFRRSYSMDLFGHIENKDPDMFIKFKNHELDFYADPKFQIWSMHNIANGEILKDGHLKYRRIAKEYIYDFDKNQDYFDNKGKVDSGSKIARKSKSPFFIDSDLKTHYFHEVNLYPKILYKLLENRLTN